MHQRTADERQVVARRRDAPCIIGRPNAALGNTRHACRQQRRELLESPGNDLQRGQVAAVDSGQQPTERPGLPRDEPMQQLNVAGKAQNCSLYTVQGGGLDVKLWYDAQDRLVREESVEDGHTLVLELRDIVP